ncbi:MAG: methionyl-tRNA formyltransferase [Elusimicrobiota bacterium]|jgi:methionyl-tRNA formyltransferase|nr:methionyl-tRNA formyltransferase [Elusimicrobiota bacterium]
MVRILFFGTADISKPFLERLIVDKHTVLCITKPDKPADRGQKIKIPAVKLLSQQFSIPFIQVEQWTPEILDEIRAFEPDLGIAVAFGKILPENVFNLPKFGTVNIHFSLLPKFRGAAPVQYALLKGESETGVTVFYVEKELDTGPILVRQSLEIDKMDNLKTLFEKLVPLGLEAMAET